MYDGIPEPERIRGAQFVTAMSSVLYPAYPDPATSSGWAEVPAVMLLVDFAGREDIVYAAMINASSLLADDLELEITPPSDSGTSVYLMTITFAEEKPLDIAGVADAEAVGMFAEAELLLLASVDQERDDGAPVLVFAPNHRARWVSRLATDPTQPDRPTTSMRESETVSPLPVPHLQAVGDERDQYASCAFGGTVRRQRGGVGCSEAASTDQLKATSVGHDHLMSADAPHDEAGQPVHLDDLAELEFRDLLEDQFPHPLQSVVLPVIAMRKDGEVHLRGTAFSIGGNLALTATHVVRRLDGLREVALLHVTSGPSTGQVHARLLPVADVTAHEDQTDVAVLRLEVPLDSSGNPFALRPLRLGVAPPAKGQRVAVLGYSHKAPFGSVDEVLKLHPKLQISDGTVVEHYPEGGWVCRYPSFMFDGRIDDQMSGGPALAEVQGGLLAVRGVACTGAEVPEGDVPYAFASMTFTAMALDPFVNLGGGPSATFLYDLAATGRPPVVDFELVDFDRSDPARPRIGLRTVSDA